MKERVDVLIVGAGVGGLVLALALGRKGFRVCLLEHQQEPAKPLRGEILQPNGLKVLDQLGLLKEMESQDIHRNQFFHFFNTDGKKLLTVDYGMLPHPYRYSLIGLPESIQKVLLDAVDGLDSVSLCYGAGFDTMTQSKEGWIIRGTIGNQKFQVKANVVIGGDGISSKVRESAGISHRLHRYKDAYLTLVVERPPGFFDEGRYYLGKKKILALFPVSPKKLYLFYLIQLNEQAAMKEKGIEKLKQDILSIDGCVESSLKPITLWSQLGIMPCMRIRTDTWVRDGVALIGDAAHAMNPHVAQGRNQAMEDGMVLSKILEDCFAKGDFSRQALYAYEVSRRHQVECLQGLGDELTLLWNSGLGPMVWLRERIFHHIQKNPRLQYRTLATVAGINSQRFTLLDRVKALGFFN